MIKIFFGLKIFTKIVYYFSVTISNYKYSNLEGVVIFNNFQIDYEFDFLNKYIPPPREIKTGNHAAIIGWNKPFTPNELNTNDIT